jgi:hypothetical protein
VIKGQSSHWQKLASAPDAEFEAALAVRTSAAPRKARLNLASCAMIE